MCLCSPTEEMCTRICDPPRSPPRCDLFSAPLRSLHSSTIAKTLARACGAQRALWARWVAGHRNLTVTVAGEKSAGPMGDAPMPQSSGLSLADPLVRRIIAGPIVAVPPARGPAVVDPPEVLARELEAAADPRAPDAERERRWENARRMAQEMTAHMYRAAAMMAERRRSQPVVVVNCGSGPGPGGGVLEPMPAPAPAPAKCTYCASKTTTVQELEEYNEKLAASKKAIREKAVARIEELQDELGELQDELGELRSEHEELKDAHEDLKGEYGELKGAHEALRNRARRDQERRDDGEGQEDREEVVTALLEKLKNVKASRKRIIEAFRQQKGDWQREKEELEEELGAAEERIEELEESAKRKRTKTHHHVAADADTHSHHVVSSRTRATNWTSMEDSVLIGAVARNGPDFAAIIKDDDLLDQLPEERHNRTKLRLRFNKLLHEGDPDALEAIGTGIQVLAQACRDGKGFLKGPVVQMLRKHWPNLVSDFDDVIKN